MNADSVRECAVDLPTEPGVYQFREQRDDEPLVLYVGKAVDLRDRVRSYTDPRSQRIRRMVERADEIEIAVTDTETQALLLEANLIKRHQPRYNVRLKDDKSYPLVQLTNHDAPRIEITRDPDQSATVFGPYTDKGRVETAVKALRETYGLRGCSDHKYATRDRPCLDYEMGLCSAPCTDEIAAESYREDVTAVERFFGGETGVLADPLRREMETAAEEAAFERAANLRDKLDAVEAFHGGGGAAVADAEGAAGRSHSTVSATTASSDDSAAAATPAERAVDVLGVAVEGDTATVARLHSEDGQLVDRSRHRLDTPTERDRAAGVLTAFVTQYYAERDLPDALLLPERLTDGDVRAWLEDEGVAVRVPGAGREATLIDLALKNARRGVDRPDESRALADALGLADVSRIERIEGFDVSHSGGRDVVGSNVLFVDGDAEKSGYRRKKLPERNDDYANMQALVRWRAERAVEDRDDRPDPDLLLIDGGQGQLTAAREALEAVAWDVPAVALAKDEEIVVTAERRFDWAADAPQLHLLQRVRDEAHRFAVQYHSSVRDAVSTALDSVPGVGPQLRERLLRRFGSVENVREASVAELQSVEGIGRETAATITSRL